MVQINWTFQAKDDLKSIAEYISKDSARYAKFQVSRLKNRTQILKYHSHIGKIVTKRQIDILTVHHTAQDMTRRTIK